MDFMNDDSIDSQILEHEHPLKTTDHRYSNLCREFGIFVRIVISFIEFIS